MRRRPWLEIGLLIAVIALVGLWAFSFRSEPVPVATASARPRPSPRPDVQWQATWEDELIFTCTDPSGHSVAALHAERDRFRLLAWDTTRTTLVSAGTLRRRGDRLEFRGMRNGSTYSIRGRSGHWILEPLDPKGLRFTQETILEPHLRPSPDWLHPSGRLAILGVGLGTAVSEVARKFGEPEPGHFPGDRPARLAFPLGKFAGWLVVEQDQNGRVDRVEGPALEQDGLPLLNGRSTIVDLESLFGQLPKPTDVAPPEAYYEWPRLGVTVLVVQYSVTPPTREDTRITSIHLSPPR